MDFYKIFQKDIQRAIDGKNKGIPFRSHKLTEALGGIQRAAYYVLAAETSVGKTRLAYDLFWLTPIEYALSEKGFAKKDDVEVHVYSFEMPINRTLAIVAARYLHLAESTKYTDSDILGIQKEPSEDIIAKTSSQKLKKYMEAIQKNTKFYTHKDPKRMFSTIESTCKEQSKVIGINEAGEKFYEFKNPDKFLIVILDHLGNIASSGGNMERNAILRVSQGLMELRNKYGITILALQQANPTLEKTLIPTFINSRDAKDPAIDSDCFFGVGNPYKLGITDVNYGQGTYHIIPTAENGYRGLKDKFRMVGVSKSRYGGANARLPLYFEGGVSVVRDIAPPENVNYKQF